MKNIETLHGLYVQRKFGLSTWKNYVDWAVSCLVNQQDNDDNNIVLLASATDEREATELTAKILETWLPNHQIDEHYWAGQYIVELQSIYSGRVEHCRIR